MLKARVPTTKDFSVPDWNPPSFWDSHKRDCNLHLQSKTLNSGVTHGFILLGANLSKALQKPHNDLIHQREEGEKIPETQLQKPPRLRTWPLKCRLDMALS